MASSLKNVMLIGASGSVGKIILDVLREHPEFNVTVLTRQSSEASFPAGLKVHRSDFSVASLESAFQGQDAVISAVGMTGFNDQKTFIDAAARAGVKRFLPSEFSSNHRSDAVLQLLPLFGSKREVLEYLKAKEAEGLTWTGVCSGLLFDWAISNGFLGFDITKKSATVWDDGNTKFTLTNAKQLGEAVVSVLRHQDQTANQYLYIASVETSQNEILAALEEATGSKWDISNITTDSEVSESVKKISAGDLSGAFGLVRATTYGNIPDLRANYVKDEKLANDLLGLKLESVKETIKQVVSKST